MATYQELFSILSDSSFQGLKNKIISAVVIAADTIQNEDSGTTNHTNRVVWAKQAFESPRQKADAVVHAIIAANKSATATQILNATDSTIQTAVDASIDIFAQG